MTAGHPHPRPERGTPADGSWLEASLRPVFALLAWIARHVQGFYSAVGLFLGIGLALVLGATLVFAGLATLVTQGLTQRFDDAVLNWLGARASPRLDELAMQATALGSGFVIWMVVLTGSIFLWSTRHRYSAALLWIAFVGGGVLNWVLKALFDRPRPEVAGWRTPYAAHSSFPSGHSATAMVVYATLAYLIVRMESSRRLRRLTLSLFAVVVLLVGASRLYLGVHFPSDVLAGYLVGFAWATFCALGIEAVRHFRERRPQVVLEEVALEEGTWPIRDALELHPRREPSPASTPDIRNREDGQDGEERSSSTRAR